MFIHTDFPQALLCAVLLLLVNFTALKSLSEYVEYVFFLVDVYVEGALRWKEDLAQKASEAYLRHQLAAPNLRKLVYGTGEFLNF